MKKIRKKKKESKSLATGQHKPSSKISQTLLDFAAPMLESAPADASPEQVKFVLMFAVKVWNGMIHAEEGDLSQLETVRGEIAAGERPVLEHYFDILVERRHAFFAQDPRLISGLEVERNADGGLGVHAEARVLLG